jgi:hypothetical protein
MNMSNTGSSDYLTPPEGGIVVATIAGEGFEPTPRLAAALSELSEALAEADGAEVAGYKFIPGLFGGGASTGDISAGDGDDVIIKVKGGGSCTLTVTSTGGGFMDPGPGVDTGLGSPRY